MGEAQAVHHAGHQFTQHEGQLEGVEDEPQSDILPGVGDVEEGGEHPGPGGYRDDPARDDQDGQNKIPTQSLSVVHLSMTVISKQRTYQFEKCHTKLYLLKCQAEGLLRVE